MFATQAQIDYAAKIVERLRKFIARKLASVEAQYHQWPPEELAIKMTAANAAAKKCLAEIVAFAEKNPIAVIDQQDKVEDKIAGRINKGVKDA